MNFQNYIWHSVLDFQIFFLLTLCIFNFFKNVIFAKNIKYNSGNIVTFLIRGFIHLRRAYFFKVSLRYNLPTIELTYLMYNAVFFSILEEVCNHHHNLNLEHFQHPQKTCYSYQHSPFHPQPFATSFSIDLLILDN